MELDGESCSLTGQGGQHSGAGAFSARLANSVARLLNERRRVVTLFALLLCDMSALELDGGSCGFTGDGGHSKVRVRALGVKISAILLKERRRVAMPWLELVPELFVLSPSGVLPDTDG